MRHSLCLAFLLAAAGAVQAQDTLYFSAIPDEDETRLSERFSAVADYLSEELGVPVEFVPVKSYPAVVTALPMRSVWPITELVRRDRTGTCLVAWRIASAREMPLPPRPMITASSAS